MALLLLQAAARRHFNPGTSRLLVGAGALSLAGLVAWWMMSDGSADVPGRYPVDPARPDKPGLRPEPVFPTGIESRAVDIGLGYFGDNPNPHAYINKDPDGYTSGRLHIVTKTPVDVTLRLDVRPGDVITNDAGTRSITLDDVAIASATTLQGAQIIAGMYNASPQMTFRVTNYAKPSTQMNIRAVISYSWTVGGVRKSNSSSVGISVDKPV